MSTPQDTSRRDEPTSDSSEAIVGAGITVAAIGILFLLLGWAQSMREQPSAALILCIIGAVLLVGGGVVAMTAKSRKGR